MRALARVDAGLAKVEQAALFLMLLALIVLAAVQVVWRNLLIGTLGSPRLWIDELLGTLTFANGLLGASLATHAGKHITIDVLGHVIPRGRPRLAIRLATTSFAIAICAVFARAALVAVREEKAADLGVSLGGDEALLASWQGMAAIPAGFALMALHFTVRAVIDLVCLIRGREPEEPDAPR